VASGKIPGGLFANFVNLGVPDVLKRVFILKVVLMKYVIALCALLVFFIAVPAHAQTGCADSPENPTAILALVGTAGFFLSHAKARRRL
jgi:XrtJ-associated TM-motif-TM protein